MRTALAMALLAGLVGLSGCRQPGYGPQTMELDDGYDYDYDAVMLEPAPVPAPAPMPAYTPPPQPIQTPPPIQAPPAGRRTHVVQPGQTLWMISGQYYGRSSRDNVQKIVSANPGLDADRIRAGQQIVIPD